MSARFTLLQQSLGDGDCRQIEVLADVTLTTCANSNLQPAGGDGAHKDVEKTLLISDPLNAAIRHVPYSKPVPVLGSQSPSERNWIPTSYHLPFSILTITFRHHISESLSYGFSTTIYSEFELKPWLKLKSAEFLADSRDTGT